MPRAQMLKAEVRRADAVITLSDYVRAQAVEAFSLDPARIRVIPHGPFFYGQPKTEPRALPSGRPFRLLFFGASWLTRAWGFWWRLCAC